MRHKILSLLHFPPPIHGVAVVNSQIRQSEVINSHFDIHYINISSAEDLKDIGKNRFSKYYYSLRVVAKVLKSFLSKEYHAFYISYSHVGLAFYRDSLYVLVAKLFIPNIIIHLHGIGINLNFEKHVFNSLIYKAVFKDANLILLTKKQEEDVKYLQFKNKYILPNGIPNLPIINAKTDLSDVIHIVFISNLALAKGILEFIEVMRLLKQSNINYKASIVGGNHDIHLKDVEELLFQFQIENNVKILGSLYGCAKDNIFASADILIHPTKNESFGLVLIEAMKYGIPIITTSVGGVPFVVSDGVEGFVISNSSVEKIYEKTKILIENNNLRIKMGVLGRKRFIAQYTFDIFEQNFIQIIDDILTNSK